MSSARNQVIKLFLCSLICSTCFQLLVLLGMAVHWTMKRTQLASPKERQMCYSMEKLVYVQGGKIYDDWNGLTERFDEKDNITLLCGDTSMVVQKIAYKTVAERYTDDTYLDIDFHTSCMKKCNRSSNQTDMLHLTEMASYASPDAKKPTKLFWKHVDSKTNLTHVEREGVISIAQEGMYFVSSQLTIWIENLTESAESEDTIFRHFVMLVSNNKSSEDILLENAMTKCDIMTAESQKTSQMEAVFRLESDDKIFVASSHPHKLVCDKLKNHLIVYRLD